MLADTRLADDRQDLLGAMRSATSACHEALDSRMSMLDLRRKDDYRRFLCVHFLGLEPVSDTFRRFCADRLRVPAPDLPAMLADDLAEIGTDVAALPRLHSAPTFDPLAVAYVVAGSRLGTAVMRQAPYWGGEHGTASRYMEDESGLGVWRALTAWLRGREADTEQGERLGRSAAAVFGLFGEALDLTETGIA